jgi:hypothetical protein
MVKKSKEKRSRKAGSSPKEVRSSTLKKYSLVLMLVLSIAMVSFGIYLYMTTSYQHYKEVQKQQSASTDELMRKMKQMLEDEKKRLAALPQPPSSTEPKEALPKEDTNKTAPLAVHETPPTLQEPSAFESNATQTHKDEEAKNHDLSEVQEYQRSLKEEKAPLKPIEVVRKKYPSGTTPRLAIIIDDVSFAWQTKLIKEIPYKVTPAFFPPTKGHPETAKLSHTFDFAMVHLPLEAKYYSRPEEDTLKTTDGIDVVERRIKRVKEWFPQIKYYNNHTGGSYTADYSAMDRLIKVMKAQNLLFVDSRTIGSSKVPAVCKKYDMFCYSRDIFLDNSLEKPLIREQLKLAVAKARKNGYAIAIGHPHKNTLEVLKDSTDLLEGIDLVYLKDL